MWNLGVIATFRNSDNVLPRNWVLRSIVMLLFYSFFFCAYQYEYLHQHFFSVIACVTFLSCVPDSRQTALFLIHSILIPTRFRNSSSTCTCSLSFPLFFLPLTRASKSNKARRLFHLPCRTCVILPDRVVLCSCRVLYIFDCSGMVSDRFWNYLVERS